MDYHRSRYVGGPKLEAPTTLERAEQLQLRREQLAAERQQVREDLTWDRVGDE